MTQSEPRIVVIGVGNADRGDDAAGRAVARRLEGAAPRGVAIVEHDGEATALVEWLEGAARAVLIDACSSGAPAGTLRRFDVAAAPLPQRELGGSTHGLGVAEAIELARALDCLPPSCVIYAIEGAIYELGAPLSPAVEASVAEAALRILVEIAEHTPPVDHGAESTVNETSAKIGRAATSES